MLYRYLKVNFVKKAFQMLVLCCFLLASHGARACSLALHEWQLVYSASIRLSSPVFPVTEMDVPVRRMADSASEILWVTDHKWYNYAHAIMFPVVYRFLANHLKTAELFKSVDEKLPAWALKRLPWPLLARWTLLPKTTSVGELAYNMSSRKAYPLIIGSDKNTFKAALFVDKNSNQSCYNLVIAQDGRVRVIHPDPGNPWAKEISSRGYLSVIFYKVPVPGLILNISVFPIGEAIVSMFEHEELVRKLLDYKLLLPRPVSDNDPESIKIPELPE